MDEKKTEALSTMPLHRLIPKLCVPSIIIMLVNILYNLADIFFIGKLKDPLQVSALSASTPIYSFTQAFNMLLGGGASIAISIALGKKDTEKAKRFSSFAVFTSIAFGLVIAIVANIIPGQIADLLGANDDFRPYCISYIRILCGGAPLIILSGALSNLIKSDGSSIQSTLVSGSGTLLNLALDPLFILAFGMGVQGAALASVLGYVLSTALGLFIVIKQKPHLSLNIRHFSFGREIGIAALLLGFPQALSTALSSFSSTITNHFLLSYGSIAVAANGVGHKASYIIMMICMGVSFGVQPAISFAYGRKNLERMKSLVKVTAVINLAIGTIMTVFLYIFRSQFIAGFIDNEELIQYGEKVIVASLVTSPIVGLTSLSTSFLQSTGKVTFATIVSMLRQGIIYIPCVVIMNAMWGFDGIIYSHSVSNVLSLSVSLTFCFIWYRKMREQFNAPQEKASA